MVTKILGCAAAALTFLLSGCGGGGEDGDNPVKPSGERYAADPATSPVPESFTSSVGADGMPAEFAAAAADAAALSASFAFDATSQLTDDGSPLAGSQTEGANPASIKEGWNCSKALEALNSEKLSEQVSLFAKSLSELKGESLPAGVTKETPTDARASVAYVYGSPGAQGIASIRLEAGANENGLILIWTAVPAACAEQTDGIGGCIKTLAHEFFFAKGTRKLASRTTTVVDVALMGTALTTNMRSGSVFESGKVSTRSSVAMSGSAANQPFSMSSETTLDLLKVDETTFRISGSAQTLGTQSGQAINRKNSFAYTFRNEGGQCTVGAASVQ